MELGTEEPTWNSGGQHGFWSSRGLCLSLKQGHSKEGRRTGSKVGMYGKNGELCG